MFCCRNIWRVPRRPVFLLLRAAREGPFWEGHQLWQEGLGGWRLEGT